MHGGSATNAATTTHILALSFPWVISPVDLSLTIGVSGDLRPLRAAPEGSAIIRGWSPMSFNMRRRHAPSCASFSSSAHKMFYFALLGQSVWNTEYSVLLKSCPPCFLIMIGGTHPAQGIKQIPLIRQVYAEVQRQLPTGDPTCDGC